MLYDGATVVPFVNSTDLFVQIRKILAEDPGKPACIWAYWGLLDTIQHQYGTWSEEAEAEVRNLGYSLKRELLTPRQQSGKGKACLMVLADHGHIQVDAPDVIDLRRLGKLEDFLGSPPAGTGRSAYLHLRSGESRKAQEYFKKALGDRALVVGSQKLLKEGLWGPGKVRPEFAGRVGDLVVLPVGNRSLFYPYWPGSKVQDVVGGRHGGLHEEEMLIPFFCAPV
jgi:predicted AlkP superfamily pyrophosphatase or phosphodiesterase